MIEPEELKRKWIHWVKQLTGIEEYRVGRSYNKSFTKGALILNQNPDVDPNRFCRVQVLHAMSARQTIWPTLLAGNSLNRYRQFPSEEDEAEILRQSLIMEITDFARVVDIVGFEVAVGQELPEHTPVFIGLMYFDYRESVPAPVLSDARSQFRSEPMYARVLPETYVKLLEIKDD